MSERQSINPELDAIAAESIAIEAARVARMRGIIKNAPFIAPPVIVAPPYSETPGVGFEGYEANTAVQPHIAERIGDKAL